MVGELSSSVCVVGVCNTDLITYASRIPAPGETILGVKTCTEMGGKGANQAVQAARLGADVMMVAKVGDDVFGKNLLKNLSAQHVDTMHVTEANDTASGTATIAVDMTSGANSIICVPAASFLLSPSDIEAARPQIRKCALLLCQLEISIATAMHALKVAKQEGVMTVLNTAPVVDNIPDEIWAYCDIVCPNEVELHQLTGLPTSTNEEVFVAAEHLKNQGVKKVIVTLGKRGAAIIGFDGPPVVVQATKVNAVDTTGAGDSFLGAVACFISAGDSLENAVTKGCQVASVSVTRQGVQSSFPYAAEMTNKF